MFVAMPGCFILNACPWNFTISIQLFGAVSNASGGIAHFSTQRQTEQNAVAGNNVCSQELEMAKEIKTSTAEWQTCENYQSKYKQQVT